MALLAVRDSRNGLRIVLAALPDLPNHTRDLAASIVRGINEALK